MAIQEDPELTSLHEYTESEATCGITSSEQKTKNYLNDPLHIRKMRKKKHTDMDRRS